MEVISEAFGARDRGLFDHRPGHGAVNMGLKRLGAAVATSPESLDGTFSIGVFADVGTITPDISIQRG
jgi:hypothetical protein